MEIKLPFLGEKVNEAMVTYWLVEEGSYVEKNDELVEMSTSKAVFKVPAPVSGILTKIIANEGQVVEVDGILADIKENA